MPLLVVTPDVTFVDYSSAALTHETNHFNYTFSEK
jgi:hypothetical protein